MGSELRIVILPAQSQPCEEVSPEGHWKQYGKFLLLWNRPGLPKLVLWPLASESPWALVTHRLLGATLDLVALYLQNGVWGSEHYRSLRTMETELLLAEPFSLC